MKILKPFFKISFYAVIVFCVISYVSLMASMLSSKLNNTFPNFSMGFPFTYYHQFLLHDNDFHHGFKRGMVADFLIIWIITFILLAIKKKPQTTNQQQ
ncbi:hypothetical protein [Flavobacterium sp.]|uniref:hypothetical protein n=1 Tax=Flavobacterium sp. TaxID=239 RepID=UPI002FD97D9D